MAFTNERQALELIERANQVLVITREQPTLDSVSAAAAFALALKQMGKSFDVIVPGLEEDAYPTFLPKLDIRKEPGAMRAFHIGLDVSKTPLSELMYDVKDGELVLTVVPKYGEWEEKDVRVRQGQDRYNLIIAVDAPDMKSLGDGFTEHADFFYRTNIINVDHSTSNEHWGQVNFVDLNAVSTTEALFHLFREWDKSLSLVSSDVATCLLAGMISNTKSFRTKNVTPRTLQTSSILLEKGARRDEIVTRLWRTQKVSGLKLWGRVLSRLEHDQTTGIVWSNISEQDLIETGADIESLETLVDDVFAYAPEARAVVFFSPHTDGLRALLFATPPLHAGDLARTFGASGTQQRATFLIKGEGATNEKIQNMLARLRLMIGNSGNA